MVRRTVDELLADARKRLQRVAPEALAAEQASGALVIDIRTIQQRRRDGELPGSMVIDRNVLEWRLDPASLYRISAVTGYECRIIVVCNEGYSSSLAAATLHDLGLSQATDLIGGYEAWSAITPGAETHEEAPRQPWWKRGAARSHGSGASAR